MMGGTGRDASDAAPRRAVALLALILVGFNLRPAVTSLGAVLTNVQADTHMSDVVAGLLTSIPPLMFGLVGLLSQRINTRFGLRASLATGMAMLGTGLMVRMVPAGTEAILLGTALALAGIAAANVLMPVAVKQWAPRRIGAATSAYTIALAAGNGLAAGVTAPLASSLASWRQALGLWAVPAALAVLPLAAMSRRQRPAAAPRVTRAGNMIRDRRKAHAFVVFFGMQTLGAFTIMGWLPTIYGDAGLSSSAAGANLAIVTVLGAPVALVLPPLIARREIGREVVWFLMACMAVAYVGLLLAPAAAPVLWAVLLGMGFGAFPLALALIGLRTTTPEGTAQLSTMTQGRGFLLAALGPLAIGALHQLTDGWVWPLLVLVVLLIPQLIAGLIIARPGSVEDAPGPSAGPASSAG